MTIVIQTDVFVIMGITAILCGVIYWFGKNVKNADPLDKPSRIVTVALFFYRFIDDLVGGTVKDRKIKGRLVPYVMALSMFLFFSNIFGLTGFESPTANFSVTLTLAAITFTLIQYTAIKVNGVKGYIKNYFEPFVPFVVLNVFGTIAPLISMSMRLFGNILSGSIIMTLLYTFTGYISSLIPVVGQFNFLGVVVTPIFHAYFDLFAGFIQMYIFITLTSVFIGNELPND
ncbi:MAG: F0F1 ATP synthase subunit A [Erysipelotrichaceae bacterium]